MCVICFKQLGFSWLPLVKCYSVYFISLIGVLRVLGYGNIEIRPLIVILKWLRILLFNLVTSFYVSTFS